MNDEEAWTPRLKGSVYCSPACGGDCRKSNYDKAKADADALAKKLGNGWEPHVWENLGWHWEVRALGGMIRVAPDYGDGYRAVIQGGEQFIANAETPQNAMEEVIDDMDDYLKNLTAQRKEIEALFNKLQAEG